MSSQAPKTTAGEAIPPLIARMAQLAQSLRPESGCFADEGARTQLVRAAEQLAIAARYPDENIFFAVTRVTESAAIRAACALDLFGQVPADAGAARDAGSLAAAARASELVVVRLMRVLVACHIFDEVAEHTYAHNALSRAFLVPESRSMFEEIYDLVGKGAYALPEFLEASGWANPEDYHHSAFHLGAHTDLGLWEYLEAHPAKLQAFNNGMRSQATVKAFDTSYPFDTELGGPPAGPADAAVLVDVGGGRGHALERIRQRFPTLAGRMVLQDQAPVLADAVRGGLAAGIEPQAASFFERNPEAGARAYLFRRVLHDWSDPVCRAILANTAAAMGPASKVLVAEYEVPATGAPAKLALQDLNMMAIGGTERTGKQWAELLASAGLALAKVWRTPGSDFVILEARLASTGSG